MGFHPLLVDSNDEGGYHLRCLFRDPVSTADIYAFLRWLTADFAKFGFLNRPECFPKQIRVDARTPYGNWLRIPGRHHKHDHWSRIWDGSRWLEGNEAVEFLLTFTGDDPDLLLSSRVEAYAAKLPNLGEAEAVGQSELIRVTDLDEDLQVAAAELSTHTALDGGALVESIYVERILAARMEAML